MQGYIEQAFGIADILTVAGTLVRAGVATSSPQIAPPDTFLAAGPLPTLHDQYGLSVSA